MLVTWSSKPFIFLINRVQQLLKLGASREKLILGIPTYGRSFTLGSSSSNKPPNANFVDGGKPGPLMNQKGFLGYQEICLFLKEQNWSEVPLQSTFGSIYQFKMIWWISKVDAKDGPYAYKGDQWVGYDTKKSAVAKVNYMAKWRLDQLNLELGKLIILLQANYVLSNNLGGAMFWETSTDDFNVGNISFTESFDLQCILHYRIDVEEAIILL